MSNDWYERPALPGEPGWYAQGGIIPPTNTAYTVSMTTATTTAARRGYTAAELKALKEQLQKTTTAAKRAADAAANMRTSFEDMKKATTSWANPLLPATFSYAAEQTTGDTEDA